MSGASQDERYASAAAEYGPALERLARAYEADADLRRDLIQELHVALWRSFVAFDGRCSLRTWIYRVAHNTAASYVLRQRRANTAKLTSIEDLDLADSSASPEDALATHQILNRLTTMIRALKPLDAQVMLLYLEDLDAAAIGEITGLSASAVATRVHRIRTVLTRQFQQKGGRHGD